MTKDNELLDHNTCQTSKAYLHVNTNLFNDKTVRASGCE